AFITKPPTRHSRMNAADGLRECRPFMCPPHSACGASGRLAQRLAQAVSLGRVATPILFADQKAEWMRPAGGARGAAAAPVAASDLPALSGECACEVASDSSEWSPGRSARRLRKNEEDEGAPQP